MSRSSVTQVDVLIIGAGPAGLALANWFRNSDIRVYLLDKKPGTILHGQAEGLKSTTVEIFESFGIGPQVWTDALRLEEVAVWGPASGKSNGDSVIHQGIVRELVFQDKVEELGKTREVTLEQSRAEYHMHQNLLSSNNIHVAWSTEPTHLSWDENVINDQNAYPITVTVDSVGKQVNGYKVESLNGNTSIDQIEAKYVVGCDGAHSWTRKQLGVKLDGDATDSIFGVMDIVPKTNFPDVRKVCYLRASTGTILLVPRPHKEVRMYIPVQSDSTLSDPKNLTFERIVDAARKIIHPYTLDVGSCSWWSAYRVGQRVGNSYSQYNRAFLVGDAVHTHSPKAGQGMNTSVQDAYNLGWKLRLVLQGRMSPNILSTYESERRPVAQDLISFDRGYLKLFSAPSATFDNDLIRGMKFTTGLSIRYNPSSLVQLTRLGTKTQELGPSLLKADLSPGKRLPDFQVVYQADGRTTYMHPRLATSGAFRILAFVGNIAKSGMLDDVHRLGEWLDDHDGLRNFTTGGDEARVEVLLIHSAARDEVELLNLPSVFRPWSEQMGYDYWRVFADVESAHEGHGRAYERLGIDQNVGCNVVVRPDGYVGTVTEVLDFGAIKEYFNRTECGDVLTEG